MNHSIASGISPIHALLDRLEKVKGRNGKYSALCPAHDDRDPSLSLTEAQDGKVLIRCHSGCPADVIVAAIGLELKDLFPESNLTTQQKQQYRKQKTRAEVEAALSHELTVLSLIMGTRVAERQLTSDSKFREQRPDWRPISNDFWEREILAAQRVSNAIGELYERGG